MLVESLSSLQRSNNEELELGAVLFTIISIIVASIFVPIIKLSAATFIAAAFRTTAFFIFGEDAMARIVGDEGYIHYAYLLIKHYVGFGPLLTLSNNPFDALIKLLSQIF